MFLAFVLSLSIVSSVFASENAPGLRGANVHRADEIYGNQDTYLKEQEKLSKEFLEKLMKVDPNVDNAASVRGHYSKDARSSLEYQGGNPKLSFDGYLITKHYANGKCSGEAVTATAVHLGCHNVPLFGYGQDHQSVEFACGTLEGSEGNGGGGGLLSSGESRPAGWSYFYEGPDCSGNLVRTQAEAIPTGCLEGMKLQCLTHSNPPNFAKKDGLFTYKFHTMDDCVNFSWYYLQEQYPTIAYGSSIDFDDALPDDGNGNDGEGGGGNANTPQSLAARSADATAAGTESARVAAPVATELQQHQKHPASASLAAPDPDAIDRAALSPADKEARLAMLDTYNGPYREYAVSLRRNGICAYDDKYGLYVKTTCHGRRKTLAYYLFIDSKCTRPIQRVEHDIYSAVPYYDQCVFSSTDQRAALTVCHNSGGSSGGEGVTN